MDRNTYELRKEYRVYGYADLRIAKEEYETAAKALEHLQAKGVIKKISKGIFLQTVANCFWRIKTRLQ